MDADERIGPRFGLGAIDQISFAVPDLDEALPRYTAMFGGPFSVMEPDLDVVVRGRSTHASLRVALLPTTALEVELVQVVSGDWPTLDWLAARGEGLHHVRYPVPDVDACRAEMEAAGFEVTMHAAVGGVSFAYLESPLLNGMTIELIQWPRGMVPETP